MRHLTLFGPALLVISVLGCTSEEQKVDLGPVENIAGLVGASAQTGGSPPTLLAGASPRLSRSVRTALEDSQQEIEVDLRVMVNADGEPFGVRVLETRPAGSTAAEQYAAELSQAVWDWKYEAAQRDRTAVSAYLDLKFRYDGPPTEEGAAEP